MFQLLDSDLLFSTSFYPQTDDQTECINVLLEQYLRHFVSANQKNWVNLLDVAQFCYELPKSESLGHSPFEISMGQQPLMSHTLAALYQRLAVANTVSWSILVQNCQEDEEVGRQEATTFQYRRSGPCEVAPNRQESFVGDIVLWCRSMKDHLRWSKGSKSWSTSYTYQQTSKYIQCSIYAI